MRSMVGLLSILLALLSPALTEPACNAAEDKVTNEACVHPSAPKISLVTVAPDVQVEVLDWGGTGETMVLLAGLGDNAHVYDQFAHQFTDRFHVIGITRRASGARASPRRAMMLIRERATILKCSTTSRFARPSLSGTQSQEMN